MFENIGLSKDPWDTPYNNFVLLLKHSFIWALFILLFISKVIYTEAVVHRYSSKKVFLEISQI